MEGLRSFVEGEKECYGVASPANEDKDLGIDDQANKSGEA